jgi:hypothetical protein
VPTKNPDPAHGGTQPAECLRLIVKMATPLGGGGLKAERGKGRPSSTSKMRDQRSQPGPAPDAHRFATCQGTTTSARTRRLPGATRRRSIDTVIENGGFATTRNGRFGKRRSSASALTTFTSKSMNRSRSERTRSGCSSTAMTRAPCSTRGRVSAPVPAPISSTRSPGPMPASATICSAQCLWS